MMKALVLEQHFDFAHPIPDCFSDIEAAPLLCAGAIGYRSLALTGLRNGQTLGLTGFGGSAHLVLNFPFSPFPARTIEQLRDSCQPYRDGV